MKYICCATVRLKTLFPRYALCGKPAKVEHGGNYYCGIHDPGKRMAKRNQRYAELEQVRERNLKRHKLERAAPQLLEALETAYQVLADIDHQWPGRHSAEGQALLCDMRDAIAAATGRTSEDVSSNVRSPITASLGEA